MNFAEETWADCRDELVELFPRHWREIALRQDLIPLDVDEKQYEALGDFLHITTAREDRLVGYLMSIVHPHLHYKSTLMAFQDIMWIDPDYRKGRNGIRLIQASEGFLKARGVKQIFLGTKLRLDLGSLFKRLGYEPVEMIYSKWVG